MANGRVLYIFGSMYKLVNYVSFLCIKGNTVISDNYLVLKSCAILARIWLIFSYITTDAL